MEDIERQRPRGIRNCNPGNIRVNSRYQWLGQKGYDEDGFCIFTDMRYGLRALAINLINYHRYHNCVALAQYVSRWAPPTENNTTAYLDSVSQITGWPINYIVDVVEDLPLLVFAICRQEVGSGFISLEQAKDACAMIKLL